MFRGLNYVFEKDIHKACPSWKYHRIPHSSYLAVCSMDMIPTMLHQERLIWLVSLHQLRTSAFSVSSSVMEVYHQYLFLFNSHNIKHIAKLYVFLMYSVGISSKKLPFVASETFSLYPKVLLVHGEVGGVKIFSMITWWEISS